MEIHIDNLDSLTKAIKRIIEKRGINNVCLFGDMGSGKTTFTRSLLKSFGYTKNDVNSPTFALLNKYDIDKLNSVFHYDLHRISNDSELDLLDFFSIIDSKNLVIIEWPNIARKFLYGKVLDIYFSYCVDSNYRDIKVKFNHK